MTNPPLKNHDTGNVSYPGDFRIQLENKLDELTQNALAKNTRDLYRMAFDSFRAFCAAGGITREDEPHRVLALYVAHMSALGMKPNTISSYLAGVKHHLLEMGVVIDSNHTVLKAAIQGHVRTSNLEEGITKKDALTFDELQEIVAIIDDSTISGERDRTLMLVGFAGGFRRSEVSALRVGDLTFSDEGVVIRKRDSKGDRNKEGRIVAISRVADGNHRMMCPVAALESWLRVYAEVRNVRALTDEDPVFPRMFRGGSLSSKSITGESVLNILRKHALAAGVNTEETERRLGAHSLRAGLITAGYRKGADLRSLARQVDHKRLDTTNGYIRDQDVFENNPTSLIFGKNQ